MAFNSCSSGGGDEAPIGWKSQSATIDARNPTTSTFIANGNWTLGDISYNQLETDILYNDKRADFSTETGWCSLQKDGTNLNITLTENTDEHKYRRCNVSITTNEATISLTITQNTWQYSSEELEPIVNDIIQIGDNDISISNGKLYYAGDTPFNIEVTLSKKIDRIEKFYPYSLHYNEWILISGDDGTNIKLKGVALVTDYIYDSEYYTAYTPYYGDMSAGAYTIIISGAYDKTFSYTAN